MPLGIEQNNIAPQLIQNSGAALVQGIRQIGQQISGHLTEIQTKRDLGALAQEMQGINVQSNDFPVQLTQLLSRHPLAARDERGQIALSILGKAHGQWQQGQLAQQRMNPYKSVAGGGIWNANTGTWEVEPQPKTNAPKGYSSVGGKAVLNRDTGQVTPLPAGIGGTPAGGLTPSQAARFKVDSAKSVLSGVNSKIAPLEKQYNALLKEQAELEGDTDNREVNTPRLRQIYDGLKSVGSQLEALGKERATREQELQSAFQEITTPPAAVVPDASLGGIVPETLAPGAPSAQDGVILPALPDAGANPITFKTPEEVRAALKSGAIPREQAAEILRKNFGFR